MTVLNIALNVVLIPGSGRFPALGTRGAAIGTVDRERASCRRRRRSG